MKRLICLVVVFVFIGYHSASAQTKDIQGWNKTRWGMTEDEVLKLFEGKATRITNPEIAVDLKGKHDAHNLIEMKDVDIQNDSYKAIFIFDDASKQLIRVVLTATREGVYESQFNELEKMLTEKYGAPSYKQDDRLPGKPIGRSFLPSNVKHERTWHLPSTVINLTYLKIGLDTLLAVEYSKNLKEAIDNL